MKMPATSRSLPTEPDVAARSDSTETSTWEPSNPSKALGHDAIAVARRSADRAAVGGQGLMRGTRRAASSAASRSGGTQDDGDVGARELLAVLGRA